MIDYTLIETPKTRSLTFAYGGELYTLTDEHPQYEEIHSVLKGQSSGITDATGTVTGDFLVMLYRTTSTQAVAAAMTALSEHISYDGSQIHYDGEPLHGTIVEHIVASLIAKNRDWEPLVKFLEKLYQNPSQVARNELYDWLREAGLTITDSGDLVAYKGLRRDGSSGDSGRAFVDGALVTGEIPHHVGSTVRMERLDVNDDPRLCYRADGLHASSRRFAEGYVSGLIATVLISPADVVAIPQVGKLRTLRTCGYRVAAVELAKESVYLGRNKQVAETSISA